MYLLFLFTEPYTLEISHDLGNLFKKHIQRRHYIDIKFPCSMQDISLTTEPILHKIRSLAMIENIWKRDNTFSNELKVAVYLYWNALYKKNYVKTISSLEDFSTNGASIIYKVERVTFPITDVHIHTWKNWSFSKYIVFWNESQCKRPFYKKNVQVALYQSTFFKNNVTWPKPQSSLFAKMYV